MPKAVSSSSISSMVRGRETMEVMAGATEIDLLVEYGIKTLREAESMTKNEAKRLIREYKNRIKRSK